MKGLEARITRLEKRLPTADDGVEAVAALRQLCLDALAMIEAGEITDQPLERAAWQRSPTTATGLQPPRYFEVWSVWYRMDEYINHTYSVVTGWRSPSHPRDGWKSYRANSAAEMAAVAEMILASIEMQSETR